MRLMGLGVLRAAVVLVVVGWVIFFV